MSPTAPSELAREWRERAESEDLQVRDVYLECAEEIERYTRYWESAAALEEPSERMLQWFKFAHLPTHLAAVSKQFHAVAVWLCLAAEPGPERTVALRKLLESKDAAVRSVVVAGG